MTSAHQAIADGAMPNRRRPALPILTSLRFFAALDVLFYHRAPSLGHGFVSNLAASGYEAVSFFFILSGFILVYVYESPAAGKGMTSDHRSFWWARFSRIIPAYLLGLLIGAPVFVYSGLVSRVTPVGECVSGLVMVPLFLQAWWPPVALVWNGPAWSLSVEAFFYAGFPTVLRAGRGWTAWRAVALATLLVIAATVVRQIAVEVISPSLFCTNLIMYFPMLHAPSFLLGMALGKAFLVTSPQRRAILGWLLPAGVAATLLLFGYRSSLPTWAVSSPVHAAVFSLVIVGGGAAEQRGLLAWPLLVLLGEASYAMYILHEPLVYWWQRYIGGIGDTRTWPAFACFATCVIVGSVVTYLWIETPVRRWLLRHSPFTAEVGNDSVTPVPANPCSSDFLKDAAT